MMKKCSFLLAIFAFLIAVSSFSALAVIYDDGDIDESCAVDFNDFTFLAAAWNTEQGEPDFDPDCDIYPDGYIDMLDALVLVDDWLLSDEVKWAEGKEFMLIIAQAILDYVAANPDQSIPGALPVPTLSDLGLTPADITGEFFTAVNFMWVVTYNAESEELTYRIDGHAPACICEPLAYILYDDGTWAMPGP